MKSLLFWLSVLIFVFFLFTSPRLNKPRPISTTTVFTEADSSSGTISLRCGNEYKLLPNFKNITLIVPPINCWTDWYIRNTDANYFELAPESNVWVQYSFIDGTLGEEHIDGPGDGKKKEIKRTILSFRYQNRSRSPTKVNVIQK